MSHIIKTSETLIKATIGNIDVGIGWKMTLITR